MSDSRTLFTWPKKDPKPVLTLTNTELHLNFKIGKKKVAHQAVITECRVPKLIPVLCSQPAGDMSHKPSGRLPLLFAK